MPRSFWNTDASFTPFFRFLDDFDSYSRSLPGMRELDKFTPRFDMTEHKDSYSLHGELPGVESKDVEIEFSDPQVRLPTPKFNPIYVCGN